MPCFKGSALILLMAICIVFVGCSFRKGGVIDMITDDVTLAISYSDEEILKIAEFTGSMNETVNCYNTNFIREVAVGYRVIYRGETKIVMLVFDASGNKISKSVYAMTLPKESFNSLTIGATLSDVRILDPNGDYLFLYTGRNDCPRISTHYTTDNFLISITYNTNNVITNIAVEAA